MPALSMLYHVSYINYNTTPLLYKVRPKAYLKVRDIKDLF